MTDRERLMARTIRRLRVELASTQGQLALEVGMGRVLDQIHQTMVGQFERQAQLRDLWVPPWRDAADYVLPRRWRRRRRSIGI